MTEKLIKIEGAKPVMVFGFNDRHLRKIESAFADTTFVARGDQVLLRGTPADIDRIERVFRELVLVLNRNTNLTENDVDTVLSLAALDGPTATQTPGSDVIINTPNGGAVKARTDGQRRLVAAARTHDIVFSIGPAGTGKTYTAVALAVAALKAKRVKRIVLSRPAVEAGERLGFLPGDLREKVDPYLRPLYDALGDMIPREKLEDYIDKNIIEIVPLAYMRGRTLHSAYVILDEAQNATTVQMKMFLTRLGVSSRAIITGDLTQTDLPRKTDSGLPHAQRILEGVKGIAFEYLDTNDVVRHRLVKDIIAAYDRYDEAEEADTP